MQCFEPLGTKTLSDQTPSTPIQPRGLPISSSWERSPVGPTALSAKGPSEVGTKMLQAVRTKAPPVPSGASATGKSSKRVVIVGGGGPLATELTASTPSFHCRALQGFCQPCGTRVEPPFGKLSGGGIRPP